MARDTQNDVIAKVQIAAAEKGKEIETVYKQLKPLRQEVESLSNSIGLLGKAAGIVVFGMAIKKAADYMIKASKAQSDYIMSLNMMNAAFKETSGSANDFVANLSDVIGLDPAPITRQLGLYRQMASSLSLASKEADILSKNLIQLQLDMMSFYNVDMQKASNAIEGALTGQTKAIRALTGADLTKATLQQELYALGVDRTVNSLTRAEKTILIYLTLERQMSNANGNMAQTMNSVANQSRLLLDQITMLGRQIGAFFIPILKAVLPYLNAILMTINAIIGAILSLLGIDVKSMAKDFGTLGGSVSGLSDGLANVAKNAKNAKDQLRGWDKLNVIRTPQAPTGGAVGGVGGIGGLGKEFEDALKEYNMQLDLMNNKAAQIRDKIMSWLGFSKDANGEWKFTGNFWNILLDTALAIGAAWGGINLILKGLSFVGLIAEGTTLGSVLKEAGTWIWYLANGGNTLGAILGAGGLLLTVSLLAQKFWDMSDNIHKASNMVTTFNGASKETKAHMQTVQGAIDDLNQRIAYFSYSGLKMSDADFQDILKRLQTLKITFNTELDNWYVEQKRKLDAAYSTQEAKDTDAYRTMLEQLNNHHKDKTAEFEGYYSQYEKKLKEAFKKDGTINQEAYLELLDIQSKMQFKAIESFAANADEKEKMSKLYNNNALAIENKQQLDILAARKKQFDEEKKTAQTAYDEQLKYLKDQFGKQSTEYKTFAEEAKNTLKAANDKSLQDYNDYFNTWAKTNDKLALYTDKTTGTISKGYVDLFGGLDASIIGISASISGTLDKTMQQAVDKVTKAGGQMSSELKRALELEKFSSVGEKWGTDLADGMQKSLKKTKIKANFNPATSGGTLGTIEFKREGGFVDQGSLFVAGEAGTEFIGNIGGKTAVANTDQMETAIAAGVMKGMQAAGGSNKPVNVNIKADADTEGLMTFIKYALVKDNRQFDM